MSPEQFSDALNYLDDDLIRQTDELRQGRRVLHRPKVVRWLIPAACLVLVLGLGSRMVPGINAGNDAAPENGMAMLPGEMLMDSDKAILEMPNQECDCSENVAVQEVTCGAMLLYIPDDWSYTLESGENAEYIVISHPDFGGRIRIGHDPSFGVCGTGLHEEETVIAGMRAVVGTFEGHRSWDFIGFLDGYRDYVVINDGAGAWCGEAMTWLDSLVINIE